MYKNVLAKINKDTQYELLQRKDVGVSLEAVEGERQKFRLDCEYEFEEHEILGDGINFEKYYMFFGKTGIVYLREEAFSKIFEIVWRD